MVSDLFEECLALQIRGAGIGEIDGLGLTGIRGDRRREDFCRKNLDPRKPGKIVIPDPV